MERLTKRIDENHACFAICEKECPDGIYADNPACMCTAGIAALKKLMKYEDMEEQGKLLILPCKLWDTVWIIDQTIVDKLIGEYSILKGFVQELTIENSNNLRIKVDTPYGMMSFDKSDIGKKVFLNEFKAQEEKEALERMKE